MIYDKNELPEKDKDVENRCSMCGEIRETASAFFCQSQLQFCKYCYEQLKRNYKAEGKNRCACFKCESSSRRNMNPNLLYESDDITLQRLFKLPKNELKKLLDNDCLQENETRSNAETGRCSYGPIKCPHSPCGKAVLPSAYLQHFKFEHNNVPALGIDRGRVLKIPIDATIIQHGENVCIAMINLYGNTGASRSSESVLTTCSRFSQSEPIGSFWLLVSANEKESKESASAYYWLFTNTEEDFDCSLELANQNDDLKFSTGCKVNNSLVDVYSDLPDNLNCLMISRNMFAALLEEGTGLNLRVILH